MQTLYELQLVKEMDRQTIELLLPFVCIKTVKDPSRYPSLKTVLKYAGQEVLTRLDIPLYTARDMRKTIWDLPFTIHCVTVFVMEITFRRE